MSRLPCHCADPRPGGMLGPPMSQRPSHDRNRPLRPASSPSSSWIGVLAGLLAGVVLVAGCAKNKPGTEAPADGAAADSSEAGVEAEPYRAIDGELASYESDLAGYEDRLLALGLPLSSAVTQARTSEGRNSLPMGDGGGETGGPRCERICGLATNICELRDRICELGREHEDEPRYRAVCERATLDCEQATEACEGCDGER